MTHAPAQLGDEPVAQVPTPDEARPTPHIDLRMLALYCAVSLGVFMVAFRPWQGGLLEEWGEASLWDTNGFGGLFLGATPGRPLHLVPHFIGLALSGGGFVGMYAVLGAVALLQLWGTWWALAPLTHNRAVRLTLGLLIAVHPWWPAGDLLRFLSAQVAVLASIVWLGTAVRYLRSGRSWLLAPMIVVPVVGLLTYQAPALAMLVAAVVLVVVLDPAQRARSLIMFGATIVAVGATFAWSAVIVPRLYPDAYESTLVGGDIDVVATLRMILRTLALEATGVVLLGVGVGAVVIALGLAQRLSAVRVWLLLGALAASPLSALAYASTTLHLHDPERVALPVGLTCWFVLAAVAHLVAQDVPLRRVVVVAAVALSVVGALVGYSRWTSFGAAQQSLLNVVEGVRDDVPADRTIVVADRTGKYGDVYLLLPPFLDIALTVEDGTGVPGVLCTPDDVVRDHPVAAVYPIATTSSCTDLLSVEGATSLGTHETVLGPVELYTVPTASIG